MYMDGRFIREPISSIDDIPYHSDREKLDGISFVVYINQDALWNI